MAININVEEESKVQSYFIWSKFRGDQLKKQIHKKRKKSKHTTTENHQITKKEIERES